MHKKGTVLIITMVTKTFGIYLPLGKLWNLV